MNEREQIKGITRLLEETHGICGNFSGCTNRKCSQCYAEAIYNAGYRKLPEDSVVLTREEYDEIKTYQSYIPEMKKAFDKIRNAMVKETAKEILTYLYEKISNAPLSDIELVNYLAKKYGVEVEE